jgi:hypothetical protein
MALTNLLLKPKYMLKHIFDFFLCFMYKKNNMFFFVWKYNVKIFLIFERLGRMHENKIILFSMFLTKTGYFNTEFVSLRYKNINQY